MMVKDTGNLVKTGSTCIFIMAAIFSDVICQHYLEMISTQKLSRLLVLNAYQMLGPKFWKSTENGVERCVFSLHPLFQEVVDIHKQLITSKSTVLMRIWKLLFDSAMQGRAINNILQWELPPMETSNNSPFKVLHNVPL